MLSNYGLFQVYFQDLVANADGYPRIFYRAPLPLDTDIMVSTYMVSNKFMIDEAGRIHIHSTEPKKKVITWKLRHFLCLAFANLALIIMFALLFRYLRTNRDLKNSIHTTQQTFQPTLGHF